LWELLWCHKQYSSM